ncbi:MAG: anti-sigma factor antagonist [Terriglobales bacterium]
MRLALETRELGRVTIVRCKGRITAGAETELLRAHVVNLLRDRKAIVLNLAEVDFVDSSGLGTMVRSLTSARQLRGDLKLCNVPDVIQKVLKMTHLDKLFDSCESEEKAVAAFYRLSGSWEKLKTSGPSVLCIDSSADVLAYLRELLRRAGYDVYTCNNLHDSLILMRVTPPGLLLLGPGVAAAAATQEAFQSACAKLPVIELGSEFSALDAGEAASGLLEKIGARMNQPAR